MTETFVRRCPCGHVEEIDALPDMWDEAAAELRLRHNCGAEAVIARRRSRRRRPLYAPLGMTLG